MSDHDNEMSDNDQEINVDTDSRLSESPPPSPGGCGTPGSDQSQSRCSSPDNITTTPQQLPFSISNLLGKNFENDKNINQLNNQELFNQSMMLPRFPYQNSVLRVPAHRPVNGPTSPLFSPWGIMDPVLQRTAAAAAFSSQVLKDRLTGK